MLWLSLLILVATLDLLKLWAGTRRGAAPSEWYVQRMYNVMTDGLLIFLALALLSLVPSWIIKELELGSQPGDTVAQVINKGE